MPQYAYCPDCRWTGSVAFFDCPECSRHTKVSFVPVKREPYDDEYERDRAADMKMDLQRERTIYDRL